MEINGPAPLRHAPAGTALTPARARVLEYVQQRGSAVDAAEVADRFALHVNTARAHLEALAASGQLRRSRQAGPGPGRPSWRYEANPQRREADARVRDYSGLAGALAGHIARTSRHPADDAYRAGVEWGTDLARSTPGGSGRGAAARRSVVAMLAELGFDPKPDARCTSVLLTRCPLLDVVEQHPELVCEVHRGLVAGALVALGDDAPAVTLVPFAEQGGCRLRMGTLR